MNNKQPFYHRVVVLFTATRPFNESELQTRLEKSLPRGVLRETVQIENYEEPEAGDPGDLL